MSQGKAVPEVGFVGKLYRTRYQKGNQTWDLGSWDQEMVFSGPAGGMLNSHGLQFLCHWGFKFLTTTF